MLATIRMSCTLFPFAEGCRQRPHAGWDEKFQHKKGEKLSYERRLVDFLATFCAKENKPFAPSTYVTNKLV